MKKIYSILLLAAFLPTAALADIIVDLQTKTCTFQWGLNPSAEHSVSSCAILTSKGGGTIDLQAKGAITSVDRRLLKFDVVSDNNYLVKLPCDSSFGVSADYIDPKGRRRTTYDCMQRINYIGFAHGATGGTIDYAIKLWGLPY